MQTQDARIAAVGRLLIAVLFIASGLSKVAAPAMTTGYIASAGLPLPTLGYLIALVVEIGGGLLLLTGLHARFAAAVMAAFTVAAGLAFHLDFADQNQTVHFLKNIALAGGLLQVVAFGAGRFSLDARRLQTA
jgi:putative oxidoreductase